MKKKKLIKCPQCGEMIDSKFRFCTNCRCELLPQEKYFNYITKNDLIISACIIAVLTAVVLITCNFGMFKNADEFAEQYALVTATAEPQEENTAAVTEEVPTEAPTEAPVVTEAPQSSRGTAQSIPEDIRTFMSGRSMTPNNNIGYDDLSYLTIPYWDFNDERKEGHMVVAADLAEDVLDIFSELYDIKYPIESMEIVDYFFDRQTETLNTPDRASMGNNNTSAFYYRVVSGTNNLSKHALGRAIDLNPKTNPYVNGSSVSPANAQKYADRTQSGWTDVEKRAFIGPDTEVYRIFRSHGWEWGGEIWSYQDYQHFQKPR